jgi:hypothetical protein
MSSSGRNILVAGTSVSSFTVKDRVKTTAERFTQENLSVQHLSKKEILMPHK